MTHQHRPFQALVIQQSQDIFAMVLDGISCGRFIRESSSSKVHGNHPVMRSESRSQAIPESAVGRDPMNTKDLFSLSFPNGQLDFNGVSFGLYHPWFGHSSFSPFTQFILYC
jgi:hypothetical protein